MGKTKRREALRGRTVLVDDVRAEAKRQARELDKVLDGSDPRRTLIARAAAALDLTTRQIYNLLKRYAPERTMSSLLPHRHGPRAKRLSERVEGIIATTLREHWLVLEAPPLKPVVDEIRARCAEAGERPPSYVAVQQRIPRLFDDATIAKARSTNPAHLRRFKARPGYITAMRPLAVCQIDHTPADIHFVEVVDDTGAFVGRPYLTLTVDVFSRAILGFCLTLERPSSLSVALCMAQVLCRKDDWLAARGLSLYAWPMLGRPETLVVDGAKEFKGKAFARGCGEYGVTIRPRHRGNVHQGGVVERLLGKLNGVLRTLPGRTGRSIADRDGYPAEERACLTFTDLERCIALAILDHNRLPIEKTLIVPNEEWRARSHTLTRHNDDPSQVLINFLPGGERRLTPQGVSVHAIDYYAPWLGELVPDRDRLGKLEMRYDPRDLSHIYLRHPRSLAFLPLGRRDGRLTPLTLWEHERDRAMRRALAGGGPQTRVELRRVIRAIGAQARRPAAGSTGASMKSARRAAARSALAAAAAKPRQLAPEVSAAAEHSVRERRLLPVEEW